MTTRCCPRCESTNVDDDGYCWTCEYQHPAAGSEPPTGPARHGGAKRPRGGRRSGFARLLVMTIAPITTLALIGLAWGAVVVFERADAVVGAGAQVSGVTPSGSAEPGVGEDAATCVVGVWRLVSIDATFTLGSGGSFHGTGSGGTLTFAKDGTGTFDYAGWSINGIMSGTTITMTATGGETFRYRLDAAKLQYEQVAGAATATVQSHGQSTSGPFARTSVQWENTLGCAGSVLTATGANGKREKGEGDPGAFHETYSRVS